MIPSAEINLFFAEVIFLIALVLSALSGQVITSTFLQRNRTFAALAVLLSGLTVWMGLWAFTLDRYLVVGSYDDFVNGTAVSLQESAIIGAMNAAGAIQGVVGAAALAWLYTSGRRLKAR